MHRHIIFDFDGTLVDSQEVKDQIFLDLAGSNTRLRDSILLLLSKGDVTRNSLVSEIYGKLDMTQFGASLSDVQKKVSSQLDDAVMSIPLRKHCSNILELCQVQQRKMYISSSTPLQNLICLLRKLKIIDAFEIISGAPRTKSQFLRELKLARSILGRDILVIGDRVDDMVSATSHGCDFICVGKKPMSIEGVSNMTLEQLYMSLDKKKI